MYVAQSRQLKSKRPSVWLHRLPSLDVLAALNHKILYFGFAFLTASLLVGSMWAKATHGAYWSLAPMKTWPLEKFIELARRVGEQMPVRFNLGEAEQALEAALLAALPEASLIREDALLDTSRAINRATHFLGNDTGITHLAAALGLDVTVLFGPSDPLTWAPRGKGRVTVLDRMETRSVDEVVAACMG